MSENDIVYGVIDIGSNSVRGMVYSCGKALYKGLITTRLGEKSSIGAFLTGEAIERTVNGIAVLFTQIARYLPSEIFAFATEAVRSAKNSDEFIRRVKSSVGLNVEVIDGCEEGEIGLLGALNGKDGGIIDIGGASSEITVAKGGKIVYSHSMPIGAVRLNDLCGENEDKLKTLIDEKIEEYGEILQDVDFYAVGGTATSVCACFLGLDKYDGETVNGTVMSCNEVGQTYEKIKRADIKERIEKLKIHEKRAEIIVGGALLLKSIMERFSIEKITVSENDNMLGFLRKRVFKESYGGR